MGKSSFRFIIEGSSPLRSERMELAASTLRVRSRDVAIDIASSLHLPVGEKVVVRDLATNEIILARGFGVAKGTSLHPAD